MSYRKYFSASLALGLLSLGAFVGATALAAEDVKDEKHDGKVVSITGDKLVMSDEAGDEHSHTLARDVKVTLDGKACKPAALKAGMKIRVTTRGADKQLATRIEAIDKDSDFARF